MSRASSILNHITKQSYNVSENHLIKERGGQTYRGDKHFSNDNLANFGLQTSINTLLFKLTF